VIDALKRSADPLSREALRDAVKATNLDTLVGRIKFGEGPHPNVSRTPILGGQWVKGDKWPFDLRIVETSLYPIIRPAVSPLELSALVLLPSHRAKYYTLFL
jgi:branched-chain amino acid transport system substrate-binding protein